MVERKIKTVYDVVCPFCGTLCDDLEVDVDIKEQPQVIEVNPINPMQEFFNDMNIIQNQSRDPNLTNKPSFDIGGPVFANYLKWLQLAELMKLNRKIDELLEKNA